MDAFFAAVEEDRRPDLKGKPVIVGGGGDPTKRGVVSTANYEARKYGIHSAMPLRTARKLCPKGIFLPVDYDAYSAISLKVKSALRLVSQTMEDVGIDEAFLDVSDVSDSNEQIAGKIKDEIRTKTGLTCSIGIAPNKLLAKIASDMNKPNGLTIIGEGDIETVLWPLPTRKLYGIGQKTEIYLKDMGIETVGQLAALSTDELMERFGQSYGQYLYEAARGIDDSPLVTHWEPKSISRETTFQVDIRDWQAVAKSLAELTREVVVDMIYQGYQARTFTLKIRFGDFETLTRAKTVPQYTDSEEEIRRAIFACLKRIALSKRVRLIGVRASNFIKSDEEDGEP